MFRFYSDYDDDDDDGGGGDVISIHGDDSEPESHSEPAAKMCRLTDGVAMTTGTEAGSEEYWQANSYNVCMPADDTDDSDVLFDKCPQLKKVPCLLVDLRPRQMLYLPASWLFEVFTADTL